MRPVTLLAAAASSAALLLTVLLAPAAPWRLPLAVAGGVWAPGYALLAAVRPRDLGGLERNALAAALGLALAPVVGIAASLAGRFSSPEVAGILVLGVASCAVVGYARALRAPPSSLVHARLPGTAATLGVVAASLAAAGLLALAPVGGAEKAPPSLAAPDAPTEVAGPTPVTFVLAGDAHDKLLVTVDGEPVHDAAHAAGAVVVTLPASPGEHRVAASWAGVEVHFRYEATG